MSKAKGLGTANLQTHIGRRAKPKPVERSPKRSTFAISADIADMVRDCAEYEGFKVVTLVEELLIEGVRQRASRHGEAFEYPPRRRRR